MPGYDIMDLSDSSYVLPAGENIMDIKQLKTFISLSKTLNYQKTGEQLNYAPSTLYSQIQALERELDTILFQKAGRKLALTKDGMAFLPYAQRLAEDYDEALASLAPRGSVEESASVGGCEVNTGYTIIKVLAAFSKSYPSVHLSMMSVSNASIPNLVKSGAIDLGFYFTLQEKGVPGCQTTLLYQEPVLLFAAQDHPLAGKQHLHYSDLAGCDFAFPHDDCLFVIEMLRRIRENKVTIGKTSYLGGVQLVLEQVMKNGAIAIMPRSAVERVREDRAIACLQLEEAPLLVWETLIYKDYDELKGAARNLLRYCINDAQRR